MKYIRFTISVLLAVCLACPASADTLVLRDEDALSGQLVEIAEGALAFRTALAGLMMVRLAEVQSLSTDRYFQVTFKDGSTTVGRFAVADGATQLIQQEPGLASPVDLSLVIKAAPYKLNPSATSTSPTLDSPATTLDVGVLARSQGSGGAEPYVALKHTAESQGMSFTGTAFFTAFDADEFARQFALNSRFLLRRNRSVEPAVVLEIERDIDHALIYRGYLGMEAVQTLFENENMQMEGSLGAGGVFESWDPDELSGSRLRLPSLWDKKDAQEVSARMGLQFKSSYFTESLRLYPSISNFGGLRGQSESALTLPLTPHLNLKLNLIVDYENELPYDEQDEWRGSVGAGLSWDF